MNLRILPVVAALAIVALVAGCAAPLKHALDPAGRTVPGGRDVRIVVEQREIQTRIVESNMTAAAGGGLLFALIDAGVNEARVNSAEKAVVPLRDAMSGYDFDGKVQDEIKATMARFEWLGIRNVAFSKESNSSSRNEALNATDADQVAFIAYDYVVAADFNSIETTLSIALANKAPPEGQPTDARLKPQNLPYTRVFKSVVPLDSPSKEDAEDVQRWSGDGAKLARGAIDVGIQRVHWMLGRSLEQTPEAAAAVAKAKKGVAGSYAGKLVEKTQYGDLVEVMLPINMWVMAEPPVK